MVSEVRLRRRDLMSSVAVDEDEVSDVLSVGGSSPTAFNREPEVILHSLGWVVVFFGCRTALFRSGISSFLFLAGRFYSNL